MFFFFFFPDKKNNNSNSISFKDIEMQHSANKGEWSELYALYKLLVDQNLFPINKNQKNDKRLRLPILSILRYTDKDLGAEYRIDDNGDICINANGNNIIEVEKEKFEIKAKELLDAIKNNSHEASFDIPALDCFRRLTCCPKIKCFTQRTTRGEKDKSDLYIVLHDAMTGQTPKQGFSIKSELGNPPTLFNATRLTNFCYKLSHNLPEQKVNEINNLLVRGHADIQGRVRAILNENIVLGFSHIKPSPTGSCTFMENLLLIDSSLPEIIAHLLILSYTEESRSLDYLTELLTAMNPLDFPMKTNNKLYEAKVKRFISDVALGMIPSQPWEADQQSSGVLVVTELGDIDCYHVMYKAALDDYLYHDLKFETPSTSRHGFGMIEYDDNGNQYFSLNLQLRFIK